MIKKITYALIILWVLFSCSGYLWEGYENNTLTISISNPFYRGDDAPPARALALQGKFVYIELALINNQSLYNADSARAISGSGAWVETAWGGHGIMTYQFSSWVQIYKATFTDVPRGSDLKVRVIMEEAEDDFIFGMDGYYNEVGPLCHSYNPDGADLFEPVGFLNSLDLMWVDIGAADLDDNALLIPLKPESLAYNPGFAPMGIGQTDAYIDETGLVSYANSEPAPGYSKFTGIDISMLTGEVDVPVVDVAFYVSVEASLTQGLALPGMIHIYNEDGSPADMYHYGDAYSLFPSFPYKSFSVIYPLLVSYSSSGMFFSSTVLTGPELEEGAVYTFGVDTYNVSYGLAIDEYFSFSAYDLILQWSLPPGIAHGDIDFKVVYIAGTAPPDSEWDTLEEVYALNPIVHIDWPEDMSAYYDLPSNPGGYYDIRGSSGPPSGYAVIIARFPGGREFIFAKDIG